MSDDYVNPWLSLSAEQPAPKSKKTKPAKRRNPLKAKSNYGRQYAGHKLFEPIG